MPTARMAILDAGNAHVTFSVRWFRVLDVTGVFDDVSGTVSANGDGSLTRLSIAVEGGSLRTGIALRDRHLRGPRFLDAARWPAIRFESTAVCRDAAGWTLRGTLTLRGRSRDLAVTVPDERDGNGSGERHVHAEFTVPRRAHEIGTATGIRRLNPLLWAIADEVRIRVEVVLPATLLQPAAAGVPAH